MTRALNYKERKFASVFSFSWYLLHCVVIFCLADIPFRNIEIPLRQALQLEKLFYFPPQKILAMLSS